MSNKYDIVIIGAGPSGVFLAYELIKLNSNKKVLIVEQGKKVENRMCPIEKTNKCMKCKPFCNITSGFSGAGAFSDGKLLSYHLSLYNENDDNIYLGGNSGSYIKKYLTPDEIKKLLDYTDKIYLDFGADPKLEGMEYREEIKKLQAKAKKEDLDLIDIPIRHLGTEKAHELYTKIEKYLLDHGVEIKFETTVHDLIIENNEIKGVEVKPSAHAFDDEYASEKIYADKVVLGVGRKGAAWLTKMCELHGIEQKTGPVDIGIRYELPDEIMKDINKYMYEGKVIGRPGPFKDKVRTFCQNPSGFVATEVYDDNLTLVNGHSYKEKKSTNTNLAILVSHNFNYPFNKPIDYGMNVAKNLNEIGAGNIVVQRLGDIFRGKRTWDEELKRNKVVPTLKTAVAGDITYALGYRTMTDILQFIKAMDKFVEGFADPANLLYGPEIKFYSNGLILDETFQTSIKNLYSIGDGGGLTTGLMMASCSGVQLARIFSKM